MEATIRWLAEGGAILASLGAMILALVIMVPAGREIRRRLRLVHLLGLVAIVCDVLWKARRTSNEHGVTQTIAFVCAALAVARVLVVLLFDVVVERGGKVPANRLLRDVVQLTAYLVAGAVALRAADIPPTSLLTTGTVVTAIVGLALQETLGNLAAGAAIQIERPIEVGDWIRLDKGDQIGRVVSTSWRSVTMQTDDRALFVIPNGVFSKTAFYNLSRPGGGTRRSHMITVPPEYAPAQVHAALLAACTDCPEVLREPKPSVLTWSFGENGITYWVRFFISDFARRDPAQAEVLTRIWYHLHRAKIPLAVPIRNSFMHKVSEKTEALRDAEVVKDRRAAIDSVDFLDPLSDDSKDLLAQGGRRRLFGPNETIIVQGDKGRAFYLVRKGQVAVRADGAELARLGSGEFFGELALLTGSERHASVVSVTETEVFEIDETLFQAVLSKEPKVAEQIAEIVGRRQAEAHAHREAAAGRASMPDISGFSTQILGKIRSLFALD
ncbi:MAG: mechanosensitive ion channel family protein [Polyangiaceae bacterium]